VLLGHPLHPMLIPFPIAFLSGAVLFDVTARLLGKPDWSTTAAHLLAAGIVTGLAAAAPGAVDFVYTVPPESSARTRALKHMGANLSAIAVFALAWLLRPEPPTAPGMLILIAEIAALAMLGAGGYMGGTLVTRNLISVDHRYANGGKWKDEDITAHDNKPVVVAKRDELKVDQMKLLRVNGRRIALARTADGYVAFDDRCTHRGGSLAGGVMMCGKVQCLWHGSQFDAATGVVKAGPARDAIKVYEVKVAGDEVMLEV
jgi:nitrite reductase/ring-hydroxylating ferredoxin subunit/uncharacterized membrane protein